MSQEDTGSEKGMPSPEELKDTYQKTYKMQTVGVDGSTIRTSVPREVVEREARRRDLSVEEFVKEFKVSWLYDGFDGAWARFVHKDGPPKGTIEGGVPNAE